jgi:hypothetical protein
MKFQNLITHDMLINFFVSSSFILQQNKTHTQAVKILVSELAKEKKKPLLKIQKKLLITLSHSRPNTATWQQHQQLLPSQIQHQKPTFWKYKS